MAIVVYMENGMEHATTCATIADLARQVKDLQARGYKQRQRPNFLVRKTFRVEMPA